MTWSVHADAGDVYRCVDADRRIEYRDWPCAGQDGSRVDVLPNVASEIDQSAARAANAAITDRTARRMAEQEAARALQRTPPPSPVAETEQPWWWVGGGAERERRRDRDRDRPEKRRPKSPRQLSIAPNVAPLHRP